jgi:nitrogen fixation-related uncharacterized protein
MASKRGKKSLKRDNKRKVFMSIMVIFSIILVICLILIYQRSLTGKIVEDEICAPGLKRCQGTLLQECINDSWRWKQNCSMVYKICDNSTLKCAFCQEGEKKCEGDLLLTCKNESWESKSCSRGCEEGKCAPLVDIVTRKNSWLFIVSGIAIVIILIAIITFLSSIKNKSGFEKELPKNQEIKVESVEKVKKGKKNRKSKGENEMEKELNKYV